MVGEHTQKSALHIMAAGLQWKHTACLFTQMTEIPLIPLFEALWETFTAKTFKRFQFFRLKAYNFRVFWFESRKPISIAREETHPWKPCKIPASEVRIYWETLCSCWEQQWACDKMINMLLLLSGHLCICPTQAAMMRHPQQQKSPA